MYIKQFLSTNSTSLEGICTESEICYETRATHSYRQCITVWALYHAAHEFPC